MLRYIKLVLARYLLSKCMHIAGVEGYWCLHQFLRFIDYIMELYRLHYGAVSITLWSCIGYIMELYRLHYGAVLMVFWFFILLPAWCPILMSNLTILFLTKSMVIHLLYYGNCRYHWNVCITENDVRYEIPSYHEYHRSSS
jgi:hypothetical protein